MQKRSDEKGPIYSATLSFFLALPIYYGNMDTPQVNA